MAQTSMSGDHPDYYQKTGEGRWIRYHWDPAIEDYVGTEISAGEVPTERFLSAASPRSKIHRMLSKKNPS
jgi:hypothetical protein